MAASFASEAKVGFAVPISIALTKACRVLAAAAKSSCDNPVLAATAVDFAPGCAAPIENGMFAVSANGLPRHQPTKPRGRAAKL
ncbi:hypothetical protein QA639_04615 [Bradyrhizobium pachyrhizi]|uniref:hypothetical protein n=1 Tax=Bradyrhizobium pachyrhizi TaxID=280333 RepID=UPI0024B04A15|nr:hypothetical protein [Bradyrhizobium pachyrhizi]WFU60163.1 hypothetical protein QA639_04615 [Bradyrhizobium pachyrhizi]